MAFRLFVDMRSPPCRTLLKFLKVSDIPHEVVITDVLKGDQHKPEYGEKFPLKKVPAMQDGEFCMSESIGIFRYIVNKFPGQFPDHWYPSDLEKRARVDEYIAWHHEGIHYPFAKIVLTMAVFPPITGQKPAEDEVAEQTKACRDALDIFERVFLRDRDYILGGEISVADVIFSGEIIDSLTTGVDFQAGRPKVKAYMDRIREKLNPVFDEIDQEFHVWKEEILIEQSKDSQK